MILEEISSREATLSHSEAQALLIELITTKDGWIFYDPSFEFQTESLARRYLASHARMPGFFTPTVSGAQEALALIRVPQPMLDQDGNQIDVLLEGAVFLNGAVLLTSINQQPLHVRLLISREDAEFWNYPSTGRTLPGRSFDPDVPEPSPRPPDQPSI